MTTSSPVDVHGAIQRREPIDLTNILTPDWKDLGIRLELCWRLRMGGGHAWGVTISKRRDIQEAETASRAAQERRDKQTLMREQVRLIEEREQAEIARTRADLEALQGELFEEGR